MDAAPHSGAANDGADLRTATQKVDRMSETSIRLVDSETRTAPPLSSPGRALSAANLPEAAEEIKLWATEQGLRGATARDLFDLSLVIERDRCGAGGWRIPGPPSRHFS